jgi:hypothetical protein
VEEADAPAKKEVGRAKEAEGAKGEIEGKQAKDAEKAVPKTGLDIMVWLCLCVRALHVRQTCIARAPNMHTTGYWAYALVGISHRGRVRLALPVLVVHFSPVLISCAARHRGVEGAGNVIRRTTGGCRCANEI